MLVRYLVALVACFLSLLAFPSMGSSRDSALKQPKFTFELGYYGMVPLNGQRLQTSFSRYKPLPTYLRVSFLHKEMSHLSFTFNYFAKVYSHPLGYAGAMPGDIIFTEFENVSIDYNHLLWNRKNEISVVTGVNFRFGYQQTIWREYSTPLAGHNDVLFDLRSLGISLGGAYKFNIGTRSFLAVRGNYTYYREAYCDYIDQGHSREVLNYAKPLRHTANFFLGWGMRFY